MPDPDLEIRAGEGLQKNVFGPQFALKNGARPVGHRAVTMLFSCRESEIVGGQFNSEKVLLLYSSAFFEFLLIVATGNPWPPALSDSIGP